MTKKLLLLFVLVCGISMNAQTEKDSIPSNWNNSGTFSFLLNQSSYSNWVAGGDNNLGGNVMVNYNFNYEKDKWTWNSRVNAAYGLSKNADEATKKTDDKIEINSVLGYKAGGNWSYSFLVNAKTQFTAGYEDYNADPRVKISDFLSPGYFSFGPGMLWKKSDNLYLNLSPVTSRLTVVNDEQSGKFGTEEGKTTFYQLGFNANLYYKFTIMKNITAENNLVLYSDYLEEPKNVILNYELNLVMKINKYLSTNVNVQVIADDNATSKVQSKEVFGLGVNVAL
ncbi:DUF3078 domain-containing protein [Aureivirga sp. CE67]|uniref:DUF3078 domain-containing protein n=1 Tax=Aureivirga sp. CE67 TaxID=1788983 RepID=UPI0018CB784F|nr:DUF3078 domain-containing protein [Aureivirga sp. CE67]